ncbi:MAG TPA: Mur ligase family protein [Candidatus Absconditabacterales bacterium]|nr:Mur ligase family protein [Candidatus Absconditabacterales bacterium]
MKKKILKSYFKLLAFFARIFLKKHKPFVVGINGSVGKTSCRMIIYQTLCKFINTQKIYTSNKNFNGELGLSLSIFQIEEFSPSVFSFVVTFFKILYKTLFVAKPYDVLILEYGIDTPGEMEFLLEIVQPHVGVFTAIDSVHSMQFGDPGKIAIEEKKMIQNTSEFAFLNIDDKYAMSLIDNLEIDYLTYQTQGYDSKANINFENEKFSYQNDKLLVDFDLNIKEKNIKISTNLIGKVHYGYIGVALAILDIINYKNGFGSIFDKFEDLFLEYKLQSGRFSALKGINNSIIFDSTYNSSPLSVKSALNTVNNLKKELFSDREVWVMLGDMRELGDLTESDHRKIATYVQGIADRIFTVGDSMQQYFLNEMEKIGFDMDKIKHFENSIYLGDFVKFEIENNKKEIIVVGKGSQNTIFLEEAIKFLLENPEDVNNLTRQSDWWMKKKMKYFLS